MNNNNSGRPKEDMFLNHHELHHEIERQDEVCSSCSFFTNNNYDSKNNTSGDNQQGRNRYRKTVRKNDSSSADTTTTTNYDIELAKEMNQLSVQEREKVYEDIHGVAETQEETPEFIAKAIQDMDACIEKSSKAKRRAYDRAIFFRPTLAHDTKFKLMFLRADQYDALKASKRYLKYYMDKLELFGETKLMSDITLDYLTEDDLDLFRTGWGIELPHKDQVGRPIWFFDMTRYDFDKLESMIRGCWYMLMTSIQDSEVAQRKGVCDIAYAPGDFLKGLGYSLSKFAGGLSKGNMRLMNLPFRITSYHLCYDDSRMKILIQVMGNAFGKDARLRLRTHFGSSLEMQYSLSTFGIPCKTLLRNDNNSERHNNLDQEDDPLMQLQSKYIQRRREIERQKTEHRIQQEIGSGIIYYPQPLDVLVGRGRPYQDFAGNRRFGSMIDSQIDQYAKCDNKFDKTCISMNIVKQVQGYGGRFIERTEDGNAWQVIDDVAAREKTSIGFRSRIAKATSTAATDKSSSSFSASDNKEAKRIRYDPSIVPS